MLANFASTQPTGSLISIDIYIYIQKVNQHMNMMGILVCIVMKLFATSMFAEDT
jgi:hypothetical protein